MHDRLRTQRLSPMQSKDIYYAFSKYVHSYDEICLLLSVAPESHAGLFYIALGLFHKEREVRVRTADLLERISEHEAGQHWWKALSRFEKLAYIRIRKEAEAEMRSRLAAEREGTAQVHAQGHQLQGPGGGSGTVAGAGMTFSPVDRRIS